MESQRRSRSGRSIAGRPLSNRRARAGSQRICHICYREGEW
ncbi:Uncharacterised protein [Bordetella pertussis]|nr:Uncharacterised protein [Bordetella pertussis]